MVRFPRVLAASLLAGGVVAAAIQPLLAAIRPPKLQYEITTLPNGLTVVLSEDHSTPIAADGVHPPVLVPPPPAILYQSMLYCAELLAQTSVKRAKIQSERSFVFMGSESGRGTMSGQHNDRLDERIHRIEVAPNTLSMSTCLVRLLSCQTFATEWPSIETTIDCTRGAFHSLIHFRRDHHARGTENFQSDYRSRQ